MVGKNYGSWRDLAEREKVMKASAEAVDPSKEEVRGVEGRCSAEERLDVEEEVVVSESGEDAEYGEVSAMQGEGQKNCGEDRFGSGRFWRRFSGMVQE